MKKRSLLIILALFAVLAFTAVASHAETHSGSCGEGVYWSLDTETGVLEITGSGAIYDFSSGSPAPWEDLDVKTAIIGDGVTRIGRRAFAGCAGLTEVEFGKDLTEIGDYAFSGCSALTGVVIPDGVKNIGKYTFIDCSAMAYAAVGRGVTGIGNSVFAFCTGLKSVTFDGTISSIGSCAFQNCQGLTEFSVPDSVTSVGWGAFKDCTGLKKITVGNGVRNMEDSLFSGCSSLSELSVPFVGNTRRSSGEAGRYPLGYLFGTGEYPGGVPVEQTFYGVDPSTPTSNIYYIPSSLKKVTLTDCEYIPYGAFSGCASLKEVILPDGLSTIDGYAFYNCAGLVSVSLPDSVSSVGPYAFSGCTALAAVNYGGDRVAWDNMTVGEENDPLKKAAVNFKSDCYDLFSDLKNGAWYKKGVLYCVRRGYMSGTGGKTFSPNGTFTRAMFVTVLAKIDRADISDCTGSSFTDVPAGKWYSKPVEWAYQNGYASGTGNGAFGPSKAVTREQLAVFLYNYSNKKGLDVSCLADLSGYVDADGISAWAVDGMRWAVAAGLISGTDAGTLSPGRAATRAQTALIVMKYCLYAEEKGGRS